MKDRSNEAKLLTGNKKRLDYFSASMGFMVVDENISDARCEDLNLQSVHASISNVPAVALLSIFEQQQCNCSPLLLAAGQLHWSSCLEIRCLECKKSEGWIDHD